MANFFTNSSKEKFKRTLQYGTRRKYLLQIRNFDNKTFTYVREGKTFKTLPNFLKIFFRKLLIIYSKHIEILTKKHKMTSPYVFLNLDFKEKIMFFSFISELGKKKLIINYEKKDIKILDI